MTDRGSLRADLSEKKMLRWKKTHFVLTGRELRSYKDRRDSFPQEIHDLTVAKVQQKDPKKYVFSVYGPKMKREVVLKAGTQVEYDTWVNHLNTACDFNRHLASNKPIETVLSGPATLVSKNRSRMDSQPEPGSWPCGKCMKWNPRHVSACAHCAPEEGLSPRAPFSARGQPSHALGRPASPRVSPAGSPMSGSSSPRGAFPPPPVVIPGKKPTTTTTADDKSDAQAEASSPAGDAQPDGFMGRRAMRRRSSLLQMRVAPAVVEVMDSEAVARNTTYQEQEVALTEMLAQAAKEKAIVQLCAKEANHREDNECEEKVDFRAITRQEATEKDLVKDLLKAIDESMNQFSKNVTKLEESEQSIRQELVSEESLYRHGHSGQFKQSMPSTKDTPTTTCESQPEPVAPTREPVVIQQPEMAPLHYWMQMNWSIIVSNEAMAALYAAKKTVSSSTQEICEEVISGTLKPAQLTYVSAVLQMGWQSILHNPAMSALHKATNISRRKIERKSAAPQNDMSNLQVYLQSACPEAVLRCEPMAALYAATAKVTSKKNVQQQVQNILLTTPPRYNEFGQLRELLHLQFPSVLRSPAISVLYEATKVCGRRIRAQQTATTTSTFEDSSVQEFLQTCSPKSPSMAAMQAATFEWLTTPPKGKNLMESLLEMGTTPGKEQKQYREPQEVEQIWDAVGQMALAGVSPTKDVKQELWGSPVTTTTTFSSTVDTEDTLVTPSTKNELRKPSMSDMLASTPAVCKAPSPGKPADAAAPQQETEKQAPPEKTKEQEPSTPATPKSPQSPNTAASNNSKGGGGGKKKNKNKKKGRR
eukprot:TRINITY_DN65989_c5_g12_i1.p1 TRINITY_DN65989_c5_g12~~TRINITY_DN65989_c5_g12_i1.p1  ORF type:complete len:817 (-),score=105.55 TRINITY_DN65989_c5_g12_i1:94-2544(-)